MAVTVFLLNDVVMYCVISTVIPKRFLFELVVKHNDGLRKSQNDGRMNVGFSFAMCFSVNVLPHLVQVIYKLKAHQYNISSYER